MNNPAGLIFFISCLFCPYPIRVKSSFLAQKVAFTADFGVLEELKKHESIGSPSVSDHLFAVPA
jgi:hypothetical protein